MALRLQGFIDLPPHAGRGGFDHAAVHGARGRVYVAHTANDAVDVIDLASRKRLGSVAGLTAVAGALVAEDVGLVFTSNRGEDTVAILTLADAPRVEKVGVGIRPNGLAYDPARRRLLAAHVGDPAVPGSWTVSLVDIAARRRVADVRGAGRTRWAVPLRHRETVPTEAGAHTLAFDPTRQAVCAFLPGTHRAALYVDGP